jgi:hypothetical protein
MMTDANAMCPICMEKLHANPARTWLLCCGQCMCVPCEASLHEHNVSVCPYCRAPFPDTNEAVFAAAFRHAHKGKIWAKIVLGQLYMTGDGGTVSMSDARICFEQAAASQSSIGLLYLGHMHVRGDGCEQSYAVARPLYEQAASQGLEQAVACLGVLDALDAEKMTGDADSTFKLGQWFRTGEHVGLLGVKSNVDSLQMMQLAIQRGCTKQQHAQTCVQQIEKELQSEQKKEDKKKKKKIKQQQHQRSHPQKSTFSKCASKCDKWWSAGTCKFGDACRNSHAETGVIERLDLHPHTIGPDVSSKRKKNKCDICGEKTKMSGYRCAAGCDWDVCASCVL